VVVSQDEAVLLGYRSQRHQEQGERGLRRVDLWLVRGEAGLRQVDLCRAAREGGRRRQMAGVEGLGC
jgi:hypothetical protein